MIANYRYSPNTGIYEFRSFSTGKFYRFRLGKNPRFELEKD